MITIEKIELEINGEVVSVGDLIKYKVDGQYRKIRVVREIDTVFNMIKITTNAGDQWIKIADITQHYKN